ncbi:hypothetical protein D3C81_2074410 [compost metagenome]
MALARGSDEDFQLAADFFLTYIFVQLLRTQRALYRLLVGGGGRGGNDALFAEIVGLNTHGRIVARRR